MTTDEVVLYSVEGAVARITLNRPEKRNALNDAVIAGLKENLKKAAADKNVRVVVIAGAGKDFCSGADLSALKKIRESSFDENLEDAKSLAELFTIIRGVRVPVIAAVHGRALAGGCGLATACDLVVATKTARFGYPEVKIGFVPAMVAAILRRNLGEKKSFELLTQGFEFSAGEAHALGLVNRVVSDYELENAVTEFASVYTKVSGTAVEMTKRLIYDIDGDTFETAVEKGVETNAHARMTDDCQSGIKSFLTKD